MYLLCNGGDRGDEVRVLVGTGSKIGAVVPGVESVEPDISAVVLKADLAG